MDIYMGRLNWTEVAYDVSSVVSSMNSWWMEPMIIRRWQINNHVHKLVASLLDLVQHSCHTRIIRNIFGFVFNGVLTNLTKHEFIESIWSSFDAVDSAVLGVDLATSKDASIARGAHRFRVLFVSKGSSSVLQVSGKEFGECCIVSEIFFLNFAHIDAVELGKASIHQVSDRVWHVDRAAEASEPWDDSCGRDDVLERLVLLQCLVDWVEREPSS